MTVTMKADDGSEWEVTRDREQVIIHDTEGNQRLVYREGMLIAASAINMLAKQDREKLGAT